MTPTSSWTTRAVAHVAAAASDGAVDRSLRVTLDFHPDRVLDGMRVLECLARDGVYRSQFETGTSNGGLTAHPGGDRWRWEQRIFGHAYDDRAASQVRRPEPSSAADRRCTTLRVRPPPAEGVSPGPQHLLLPRLDLRADGDGHGRAFRPDPARRCNERRSGARGALDDYVEAHVHGTVRLDCDVEALVLDPRFRGTEVEDQAHTLGVPVEWHEGGG